LIRVVDLRRVLNKMRTRETQFEGNARPHLCGLGRPLAFVEGVFDGSSV